MGCVADLLQKSADVLVTSGKAGLSNCLCKRDADHALEIRPQQVLKISLFARRRNQAKKLLGKISFDNTCQRIN